MEDECPLVWRSRRYDGRRRSIVGHGVGCDELSSQAKTDVGWPESRNARLRSQRVAVNVSAIDLNLTRCVEIESTR